MNITILANRDLASNLALNQLLPALAANHTLNVLLSSRVGGGADGPDELAQLRFFEQTLFNQILFPALDRGNAGGACKSFQQLGQYTRAPPTTLNAINSKEGLATLAQTEPDLVLCIRYGGILRDAAIAIPPLGVVNLHSGRLPDYRGVMASFRALLNGDGQLGTTIHYISDASIDTGDILGCTTLAVDPGRSYLWHVLQLYPQACTLLAEIVSQISAGATLARRPQPAGGNYYSFPSADELEKFRDAGFKLYDVDEIAELTQHYLDATQ